MKKTYLLTMFTALMAFVASAGHFNGGRTVPVHKLVPRDSDGEKVSVLEENPRAISTVKTCGQCHEVMKMAGGSHFRTGLDTNDAPPQVNFEPWFLVDEKAKKVTALTLDGQPGTKRPSEAGMTAWGFVKEFGRAFPGGGVGCDARTSAEQGGDKSRWFVTGKLEPNCFACHQQGTYDSSEWARQVLRENWGGAACAAALIADVGGMNSRLDAAWDASYRRENPDDHLFRVPMCVKYDKNAFDDKGRCLFKVGKPENARCLACHAAAEKGMANCKIAGDVHLDRGMKCIDCHTSGMDHRMETKSCASCHLEPKGAGPKPAHVGFPLVHFEKLSCTVCHSGVTKDGARAVVQTARANRIGIYGKAQWACDLPLIEEPFFRKDAEGRVSICRRAQTSEGEIFWPFAHDVRPARQARGALPAKCADCHTWKNDFFAGWDNETYHTILGGTFAMRPLLKFVLWTIFGILCIFTAASAATLVNRMVGWIHRPGANAFWRFFRGFVLFGLLCCALALAATGLFGWFTHGMTGYVIMLHMCFGGAFAGAAALLMFFRAKNGEDGILRGTFKFLFIALAAAVVFTAVMPMMTVFGSTGQCFLLWAHRLVALAFLAVCAALCLFRKK